MEDTTGIKYKPKNYKRIVYKQEELIEKTPKGKNLNWGEPYTLEEREKIEYYINLGYSCSKISEFINRSKNGIVTEVRRGGGKKNYRAIEANEKAKERNILRIQKLKVEKDGRYFPIREKIRNLEMQIEILIDIINQKERHGD